MKPESADSPLSITNSSVHPLKELQEKGIQKIRVVTPAQLRDTARKAVSRALLEMLDGLALSTEQHQQILARANQYVSPTVATPVERGEATKVIQEEKVVTNPMIKVPSPIIPSIPTPAAAEQASTSASDGPLGKREKALLIQLSKLIARDWRTELATVRDTQNTHVERLEMRIEELTLALQATDHAIAVGGDLEIDQLEVKSPFDHKKSELLDQLFQANVALRAISEEPLSGDLPSQPREGRSS
ncbi:MAG: hypothetical protein HN891_03290 [Planctomycetes bacterium]|jgi:hypothetical protein|nr:hypothetical protein [Planctomycetota bacterium]MBT6452865.1 hypothetical protein [Planctomycetota bacterium]MBT6541601.1 hypothetical protein [Planctomycetota bacterium]MBT6783435.1 hypothetical protein [Planctomycetota bacterium]MBT6967520.1 hypothetical protein [Planctomycetota bacterium]